MDEQGRNVDDKGILDTVRRILSEDQARAADPMRRACAMASPHADDDVFELEPTMIVDTPAADARHAEPVRAEIPSDRIPDRTPARVPDHAGAGLVDGQTEQLARSAMGSLRSAMREQRSMQTHRGGPTMEDMVRDEIRPLLREWLDANLPSLVERLVRSEIARIVEQGG